MEKTKNPVYLKAAILTMSFVQMGTNGIAPILAQIAAAFPDASAQTVQFLMTFPSMFCVVFTLAAALLSERLPKKSIALTGLLLVAAAGTGACILHGSLAVLFVWAAVLGIGIGMTAPVAPALISELFAGGERQTMLGWQNSAANIGSMLMTFLGGFFAAGGWWFGYLVYLLALPGFFLTLGGVPGKSSAGPRAAQKAREPFHFVMWREMLLAFFFLMLYSSGPANLSMLVGERQMGGAATAGIMSTLFLLGGTVTGLLFGKIVGVLRDKTDTAGVLLLALGAVIIGIAPNVVLLAAGCLLAGASISLVMPNCMGAASRLKGYETLTSALILGSSNIGVFVMPLLTSATAAVTGSGAASYRFFAVAVLAVLLAALTVALKRGRAGRA